MQKILLIQLRQLGDILLTTPCIRETKRRYPHAEIDFLSHSMGRMILENNPFIDQLITYNEKDSIINQLRLLMSLRNRRYNAVVDFMYNPRSALLTLATAAPQRIAFPSRRSWAYNNIVSQLPESDYIVREKFHLLSAIDVQASHEALVLPWFESHTQPFKLFANRNLQNREQLRIVLSPTHRRLRRRWPLNRYVEVANLLVHNYDAKVIWIWGPGELELVQQLQERTQEKTYIAPPTSFTELAAFIANCDLFVGNSNGPSHVAVSTEIPTLQLHGPTIAQTWCPNNQKHRSVQGKDMESISVSQIRLKVSEMMPIISNNVAQRVKIGDRMRWDQPWVL